MNVRLHYMITTEEMPGLPVGSIFLAPFGFSKGLIADGRRYAISGFPGLYACIGDSYCPKTIPRKTFWATLMRRIRWRFSIKWLPDLRDPNPDYMPGTFRLPDLNGHWSGS